MGGMRNSARLAVLDIGGTSIKSGVYENGRMLQFKETPTQASKGGAFVVNRALAIVHGMGDIDGIGISTAGQVDFENGKIRHANANIPDYTGTELRRIFEKEFHVPAIIENDVNAAALGEGNYGAARGVKDFLCLTYGTGVGGAIVIGGKIYRGAGGSAGEFGSMVIHGKQVIPGERISGCYEEQASTAALVRRVRAIMPEITDGRQIFEKIEEPAVKKVVDSWMDEIAYGLVTLIHIFHPVCVLLGGGVMGQEYVALSVRNRVMEKIMPSFRDVQIRTTALGNKAGLWGAAYLAEQYTKNKEEGYEDSSLHQTGSRNHCR